MNKTDDNWKTPLGCYERPIAELIKTREEIQEGYQNLKAQIQNNELELQSLKTELQTTKASLSITQKTADEARLEVDKMTTNITKKSNNRLENGVWSGTAQNTPDWSILEGHGNRIFRTYVHFYQGFSSHPKVVVGLSYFDIIRPANSRLKVKVAEVDNEGFYLELHTSLDTKVWAAGVNWLAYGY